MDFRIVLAKSKLIIICSLWFCGFVKVSLAGNGQICRFNAKNQSLDSICIQENLMRAWELRMQYPDSTLFLVNSNLKALARYFETDEENLFDQLKEKLKNQPSFSTTRYAILVGRSYNTLAVAYDIKGISTQVMQHNFNALRIWEVLSLTVHQKNKVDILSKKASTLANLGTVYSFLGKNDEAILYFKRSQAIFEKLDNKHALALNYGNLGICYYNKKDFENAKSSYLKTIEILRYLNDNSSLSVYLGNLSILYLDQQNFSEAEKHLLEGLKIDYELKKKTGIAAKQGNLGYLYSQWGKYDLAEQKLKTALSLSQELNSIHFLEDQHRFLYELYEKQQRHKEALFHLKKHLEYRDSTKNDEAIQQQTLLEANYLFEKQQDSIKVEQFKKESIYELEKEKKNNIIYWIIIALILAVSSGTIIIFFLRKRKQQAILDAEKRQLEIEYRLLRTQMNPHFIFNALNSIHQYIQQENNEKAGFLLLKFSKLIRNILHHSTKTEVSLEEELKQLELYLAIEKVRFSDKFSFQIELTTSHEISEIYIPTMMLQPFVENAVIHGLAPLKDANGLLEIIINEVENQELKIIIRDNGVGILDKKPNNSHQSLSISLIEERLSHFSSLSNNTITIEKLYPGTEVRFTLPYQTEF
jgi:tetratricopeptide (TPR) repeat protein